MAELACVARGGAEQVVAGAPYANGLPAAVRSGVRVGAGKKSEKAGKLSERRRQGLQGLRGLPGWKYDWNGNDGRSKIWSAARYSTLLYY